MAASMKPWLGYSKTKVNGIQSITMGIVWSSHQVVLFEPIMWHILIVEWCYLELCPTKESCYIKQSITFK